MFKIDRNKLALDLFCYILMKVSLWRQPYDIRVTRSTYVKKYHTKQSGCMQNGENTRSKFLGFSFLNPVILGPFAEAHLEPSWTSTMQLFCENSLIADVALGFKYASAWYHLIFLSFHERREKEVVFSIAFWLKFHNFSKQETLHCEK